MPLFVFTFGAAFWVSTFDVKSLEYYSRPFPAIVAALTLAVGFKHFADRCAQVMLEDYVHGFA